jgi:chaperonin GroES
MATLRPLHDHLIVKALAEDEAGKFGIILPDTVNKERSEKGEVIAVGPGKVAENGNRVAMSVKPGDWLLLKKYAPDELKLDGAEYLIISEGDVLAVIE